jgi:hypothetical protein
MVPADSPGRGRPGGRHITDMPRHSPRSAPWPERAPKGHPHRLPANYHKLHGVRQFHGCYSVGDDQF